MKIQIVAAPKFLLPLTLSQVDLLMKLGLMHYDHTCNAAVRVGGFIYGWNNRVTFSAEEAEHPSPCVANFRELDLCLKIMEFPPLSEDELRDLADMRISFGRALSRSSEMNKFQIDVE